MAKIELYSMGPSKGGLGRGSGEAQSVSDLKFQMSCHGQKAKKNSFFEKRAARDIDDKLLEPIGDTSYNVL